MPRNAEARVRSTAADVPDRYEDVDEQLLKDYPELQPIFDGLAAEVETEPEYDVDACLRCGARIGKLLCVGCR